MELGPFGNVDETTLRLGKAAFDLSNEKKNLCFCDDFDAGVPVQEKTYVAAMDPYFTGG